MEITEVRVHLRNKSDRDSKLRAFVTVTFDNAFVVRDLKVIDGKKGLFVAMPSIKVTELCPKCRRKNPIRNRYCGDCGEKLDIPQNNPADDKQREEHRDIAHPINAEMRDYIQKKVLEAYEKEAGSISQPVDTVDTDEHFDE
ncbi:MAG: SpoVG family protein [Candidatus Ancaeobacter aquaticus]|nr:SpoVG family protein [Candidatus Ancaeobacter aquaticus]